jgi:hypothetical protein
MASKLVNLGRQLLVVPLNSGETIHLAPGESTDAVEDYELNHNPKVEKLIRENLLAKREIEQQASTAAPPAKGRSVAREERPEREA